MKKVLFVATVVKTHIMAFHIPYIKWFKENGYEVHICAKNDYENKEDCLIPYCDQYFDFPFERSPLSRKNIGVYKQLRKLIESNDYAVIHCHTPVGGVLTRIAAHKAYKNDMKVIYTAHGFHFYKGAPLINWLFYYPVERFLAKYTDVLITINKEDYKLAQSFKANKSVYIPGVGVNVKKFYNLRVNKKEKRKELGLHNEDDFVLLSVGELNRNKNHETIIEALAMLNIPGIVYIICGKGDLETYLKNKAEKLKVNVKFLGFRKDISEICAVSDLFVFPSYREGLSVALMEAMAAGLPVVCSNIRGNIDLIENGKGGFLLKPNDINGFAGAINKLARDKDLRNSMGIINQETVKKFDIENVKKEMTEIYKEVLLNG